jgi:hypothetical protein
MHPYPEDEDDDFERRLRRDIWLWPLLITLVFLSFVILLAFIC